MRGHGPDAAMRLPIRPAPRALRAPCFHSPPSRVIDPSAGLWNAR
ncbi:hypothetical protein HMPREF0731_1854 [Pseudoroseomonas cervicalis ATCC 49957]|uniref:Uncharacterized protein n=1 Tax=Pseudoroseomonas cervicalis ATCC 49957 TaxID=525371 RepID=D5RL93_9PROT|nr:hypothetical protein HMPREF0731_1854 [Pseudoroseomonas cervicalis ATCC 49957]